MTRKKCLAIGSLFFVSLLQAQDHEDIVMRAMKDELARSMAQLQLPNMEKPYFLAYRIQDIVEEEISATLGSLTSPSGPASRHRMISVELRVGDYSLDNTNFVSLRRLSGGPTGALGGIVAQGSLDDNYGQIRRELWLATDTQYKRALEDLSAKRAALKGRTGGENVPDFSKEPAIQLAAGSAAVARDFQQLEATARDTSVVFRATPDIDRSGVTIRYTSVYTRYLNSEGTSFTRSDPLIEVEVSARTHAADGLPIADSFRVLTRNPADLPTREALRARAQQMSALILKLRSAPSVDRYNGPVLFEGAAASEIFLQQFGSRLAAARTPISDNSQFEMMFSQMFDRGPSLQDKMGARILPDFISVEDNPSQASFHEISLLGTSPVDDDGVKTRETILVERGVLKNLLASRVPVRGILQSTGSRHGWGAVPSNIFLTSTKTMPADALKQELLRRAKERGLDYAIVVRRVGTGSESSVVNIMRQMASGQTSSPSLAEVYKLYSDGHEEPLEGVRITDLSAEAFKEIVATGDTPVLYNDQLSPRMNSIFSIGFSFGAEGLPVVSCVSPSLLFEEVTLAKSEGPFPAAPVSPSPLAVR